jgi:hypothetical protein
VCKIILDFVNCLDYKNHKTTTLWKLHSFCVFRQKKGEMEQKVCLFGAPVDWTLPRLKIGQSEGPTNRPAVLFPIFYLKTKEESSFQNAVVL